MLSHSIPSRARSLLCNGIIAFDGTALLLPVGAIVLPHRPTAGLPRPPRGELRRAGTGAASSPGRLRQRSLARVHEQHTPSTIARFCSTSPSKSVWLGIRCGRWPTRSGTVSRCPRGLRVALPYGG
ncbi:DUF5999 family protein [Carbonactinospora thermoautotrophica]|uniref:DUF5999 family protein n=1 Tax=Carbonactinospora thermoautotrophica TaxID=1469144 RepID=UPI0030B81864